MCIRQGCWHTGTRHLPSYVYVRIPREQSRIGIAMDRGLSWGGSRHLACRRRCSADPGYQPTIATGGGLRELPARAAPRRRAMRRVHARVHSLRHGAWRRPRGRRRRRACAWRARACTAGARGPRSCLGGRTGGTSASGTAAGAARRRAGRTRRGATAAARARGPSRTTPRSRCRTARGGLRNVRWGCDAD